MTGITSEQVASYALHCQPLGIAIHCQLVAPVANLVAGMLSGWQLVADANSGANARSDVSVLRHEGKYYVQAPAVGFHAGHKDLVSSLNELLISMAYLVGYKRPDLTLIHAGAMIANESTSEAQNILLLGGHKAGKSTYLAKQCQPGNTLVSDDLLFIDAAGKLLGLGFPLRLRRPIDVAIVASIGQQNLLVGHSLAYVGPKAMLVYPAGVPMHVDQLLLLQDYQSRSVPQTQWLGLIEDRIVPIPTAEPTTDAR